MEPDLLYKTIFISDVHLGSKGCQANHLLAFLKRSHCENLYLVGDMLDLWALSRKFFFPQSHVNVLRQILKKAKHGVKVKYVVGNHDETFRSFLPFEFGKIEVMNEAIYHTVDGRSLLVTHGDDYDQVVLHAKWVAKLGDIGYSLLLRSNRWINFVRSKLGRDHWSLSSFVKSKVKSAVSFIGGYEQAVSRAVKERGLDGVICGHIHHAEIKTIDGIVYMNDGDWVESCTALVEHFDGRFEIIRWFEVPDAEPVVLHQAA